MTGRELKTWALSLSDACKVEVQDEKGHWCAVAPERIRAVQYYHPEAKPSALKAGTIGPTGLYFYE